MYLKCMLLVTVLNMIIATLIFVQTNNDANIQILSCSLNGVGIILCVLNVKYMPWVLCFTKSV